MKRKRFTVVQICMWSAGLGIENSGPRVGSSLSISTRLDADVDTERRFGLPSRLESARCPSGGFCTECARSHRSGTAVQGFAMY